MFEIIPLILILASLSTILIIVLKKFPALANLDIENIQAEREARFKEQIISNKLKRSLKKYTQVTSLVFGPLAEKVKGVFGENYKKLLDKKESYRREKILDESTPEEGLGLIFLEIDELLKNGELDAAEKKYIEIISHDAKSVEAFKGLGKLYLEKKNHAEAKQTIEHAIRLTEKDLNFYAEKGQDDEETTKNIDTAQSLLASMYFDLSLVNRAIEDYNEALVSINKSLAIEPNKPRHLDTKLEISIINKDREGAIETFEKLKEVNPENQKLDELRKQIDEL